MQDPTQGAVQTIPSDTPQGQGAVVDTPSAAVDQNIPSPSDTPPQNGNGQGADIERLVRGFQGTVDSLRAQILQQQEYMKSLAQQTAPQIQQNPYDPQTQPTEWWREEMRRDREQTIQKTQEVFLGNLTQLARQQAETTWQNSHPNVSIADVKAFAQSRQIGNLDDAYTLMTLPQSQTNNAINMMTQFQRPQNQATPLRGTQGTSQADMQGRFDKDYSDYVNTNGAIYDTWPPERKAAFDTEWKKRESLRTGR